MSILARSELEKSPLADLHAIASELSLDGYRRLRKDALIDAIIEHQGGEPAEEQRQPEEAEGNGGRRRTRRGGRGKAAREEAGEEEKPAGRRAAAEEPAGRRAAEKPAGRRAAAEEPAGRRAAAEKTAGRRAAEKPAGRRAAAEEESVEEVIVSGVVEVLPNGSAFVRVDPPEPSDDDIYISAAQVKRCELVSGDRIAGPRRAPRRSERFASMLRIDTINDLSSSEVADSARFDELPAGFPVERFKLGSEDATLKAIEFLTPFGRGSRVTISGPAQAGKSEALRRLAAALAQAEDVQVLTVLLGVRPEEVPEWSSESLTPAAALSAATSVDAQTQAVERVLDQARRLTARGSHVVVVIDTLAGFAPSAARKSLACARRIIDGGSLTVIATAPEPVGGETTVIALDASLTATRRFPAIDLGASWTMRAELLVGDAGAELIVKTRAEALR